MLTSKMLALGPNLGEVGRNWGGILVNFHWDLGMTPRVFPSREMGRNWGGNFDTQDVTIRGGGEELGRQF